MLLLALAATAAGCADIDNDAAANALSITDGGDARAGREIIAVKGCGSCHTIPGIAGANSTVGPPLTAMAARAYVAGVLPNTPENLIRWVLDPPGVDSLTAMPALGLTPRQARDVAAYLYTLR
jgi:mono/diheme cytochrome c family protein